MTERVQRMRELLLSRDYRNERVNVELDKDLMTCRKSLASRRAAADAYLLDLERPVFRSGDDVFGFNFYRGALPPECDHPNRKFGNVTIDYETLLRRGFGGIVEDILSRRDGADEQALGFYDNAVKILRAALRLAERYRAAAEAEGRTRLAEALSRVPEKGAEDYYQALLLLKFFQYTARILLHPHMTLGRFDKYMKPYYDASLSAGVGRDELLELTELFFISINFDTDLYLCVQQGDDGQSLVLGGRDEDGNEVFSALSELVLEASEELRLIDPKINIRVNKNTPLSLYERGTKLTKQGLGFPQYLNDDVVIPALKAWGYEERDARDYSVAACWEFIMSGCGADVPNIDFMNFPVVILRAVKNDLRTAKDFDEFRRKVDEAVGEECDALVAALASRRSGPEPFLSAFVRPCIERGRDIRDLGAKYNNFGLHGAGIATAADSLSAVDELVFRRKKLTPDELIDAIEKNFAGAEDVRKMMLACPKMGNNDDRADGNGVFLLESFARHLAGKKNDLGGVFRAGTGTAQGYIYNSRNVPATPDGRYAGAPYASSYSPSLEARTNGPLSAIQSFTKADLKKVCNGGPFTIEIHDTVFRNDEGEKKVAMLIKSFIDLGGHEMQINAINRDVLLDARQHPERYPNLIVRVWGWSGYFVELEKAFQDQIIKRTEYTFAQ